MVFVLVVSIHIFKSVRGVFMLKKTKIVATISDQRCDRPFLKKLFAAGVDVVRLNTAHQTVEDTTKVVKNVRAVSSTVALLLDTKGPEIRTTKGDAPIKLKAGSRILVKGSPNKNSTSQKLYVTYDGFVADVPVGKKILIDDGELALLVKAKKGDSLDCEVLNGGEISGRKSVNIPGVHINLPSLSPKDRKYIEYAAKNDIDFVAHSFVRNKDDVLAIKRILKKYKSDVKIIAKIENQQGVDNLPEILDHAYGIMVARGDLGIEIPAAQIPLIQKHIIRMCIERNKPVITATQMLHTMIKNPRPTRAEVSDIANAILDDTDAIMLSGETAYGQYPLESVEAMTNIARVVEEEKDGFNKLTLEQTSGNTPAYLAKAAVKACVRLPQMQAIILDTLRGSTARRVAGFRPKKPVHAMCYDPRTMRELSLSYGVDAHLFRKEPKHSADFAKKSLDHLTKHHGCLKDNDLVVLLAGNFTKSKKATFIEIDTVKNLRNC